MRIGAHVDSEDPLAEAVSRGADVVQFFLTDPQGYASPNAGGATLGDKFRGKLDKLKPAKDKDLGH